MTTLRRVTAPFSPAVRSLLSVGLSGLLTAVALLPYCAGLVAGGVVQMCVWVWSGMVLGWRDGRDSIRKRWSR